MSEILNGEVGKVFVKDMTILDLYTLLGAVSVVIATLICGIILTVSLGNQIGDDIRKLVKNLIKKYRKNDSLTADK